MREHDIQDERLANFAVYNLPLCTELLRAASTSDFQFFHLLTTYDDSSTIRLQTSMHLGALDRVDVTERVNAVLSRTGTHAYNCVVCIGQIVQYIENKK